MEMDIPGAQFSYLALHGSSEKGRENWIAVADDECFSPATNQVVHVLLLPVSGISIIDQERKTYVIFYNKQLKQLRFIKPIYFDNFLVYWVIINILGSRICMLG